MTERGRDRALLIYDGDCAFCRTWSEAWRAETGDRVRYATSQEVASGYPDIPRETYERTVLLIDGEGKRYEGAAAVFRALSFRPGRAWYRDLYHAPLVAPVCEWAYRIVARHRVFFAGVTRLLWGPRVEPARYALTARLFLQALGVVYLFAFVSLIPQLPGLVGPQGLLPSGLSGGALQVIAAFGAILAVAAAAGFAVAPVFLLLWASYLVLSLAGQDFLSFQWDALLLEAGFLAVFLAPFRFSLRRPSTVAASRLVVWLFRFLLFRLILSSGLSKLASGDHAWRDLTALGYHFETQPLPTPLAWYAHRLPVIALRAMTFGTLAIELVVPFLFFLPRRARQLGAVITTAFQLLLMATGNFAFFNILTLALCLTLLDDAAIEAFLRKFRLKAPTAATEQGMGTPRRLVLGALGVVVVTLGLTQFAVIVARPPLPMLGLLSLASPLRLVNGYGLFGVMTTERPEIIIEGSDDGNAWKPYAFRDKPDDVKRRPSFVAPFQPRLDWQLWFAALGTPEENPWFRNLLLRLLQGSKPVLALFKDDPFPVRAPKFVRAELYVYRFTTPAERRGDGACYRRRFKVEYAAPVSLQDFQGARP